MKFGDLNLDNVESILVEKMKNNTDFEEDFLDQEILIDIDELILENFNSRKVNPDNVNDILRLCDFLLIENVEKFISENAETTNDIYKIDKQFKENYKFPLYLLSKDRHLSPIIDSCCLDDNLKWFKFCYSLWFIKFYKADKVDFSNLNDFNINLILETIVKNDSVNIFEYLFVKLNLSLNLVSTDVQEVLPKAISLDFCKKEKYFKLNLIFTCNSVKILEFLLYNSTCVDNYRLLILCPQLFEKLEVEISKFYKLILIAIVSDSIDVLKTFIKFYEIKFINGGIFSRKYNFKKFEKFENFQIVYGEFEMLKGKIPPEILHAIVNNSQNTFNYFYTNREELFENNFNIFTNDFYEFCFYCNNLEVIKFLLENGVESLEFKLDIYSPSKADLLELYFQNNFPIEDSLFDKCVINFRPDELEICVKYKLIPKEKVEFSYLIKYCIDNYLESNIMSNFIQEKSKLGDVVTILVDSKEKCKEYYNLFSFGVDYIEFCIKIDSEVLLEIGLKNNLKFGLENFYEILDSKGVLSLQNECFQLLKDDLKRNNKNVIKFMKLPEYRIIDTCGRSNFKKVLILLEDIDFKLGLYFTLKMIMNAYYNKLYYDEDKKLIKFLIKHGTDFIINIKMLITNKKLYSECPNCYELVKYEKDYPKDYVFIFNNDQNENLVIHNNLNSDEVDYKVSQCNCCYMHLTELPIYGYFNESSKTAICNKCANNIFKFFQDDDLRYMFDLESCNLIKDNFNKNYRNSQISEFEYDYSSDMDIDSVSDLYSDSDDEEVLE